MRHYSNNMKFILWPRILSDGSDIHFALHILFGVFKRTFNGPNKSKWSSLMSTFNYLNYNNYLYSSLLYVKEQFNSRTRIRFSTHTADQEGLWLVIRHEGLDYVTKLPVSIWNLCKFLISSQNRNPRTVEMPKTTSTICKKASSIRNFIKFEFVHILKNWQNRWLCTGLNVFQIFTNRMAPSQSQRFPAMRLRVPSFQKATARLLFLTAVSARLPTWIFSCVRQAKNENWVIEARVNRHVPEADSQRWEIPY